MYTDTIYALATAPGKAGVAVVRVSGSGAHESLKAITGTGQSVTPRTAKFSKLIHPVSRETIDEALVLYFKSPASFTGEDVAEYHIHGSMAVIHDLLDALSTFDHHRMAEPGEFTRRGFENNKFDLTKAEAIADLIEAETQAQKNQALEQLGGALSSLYESWRERLIRTMAYLETDIDFSDEDLPDGIQATIAPALNGLRDDITGHLQDNRRGERLRDGIHIAVIGAPNAGKSSLVNALAQRDVAIVSSHAGTTRDVIDVHLDLGGYPAIISDTAGLRPDQLSTDNAHDTIEAEGIKRAINTAENADIRILVFDAANLPDLDPHTIALQNDQSIIVFNKIDLCDVIEFPLSGIALSVETGVGFDDFFSALTIKIQTLLGTRDTPSLTRARHREALEHCVQSIGRALQNDMPELMAEDIRLAARHIGRITGRVDVEDLLDVIFKDFCIGK